MTDPALNSHFEISCCTLIFLSNYCLTIISLNPWTMQPRLNQSNRSNLCLIINDRNDIPLLILVPSLTHSFVHTNLCYISKHTSCVGIVPEKRPILSETEILQQFIDNSLMISYWYSSCAYCKSLSNWLTHSLFLFLSVWYLASNCEYLACYLSMICCLICSDTKTFIPMRQLCNMSCFWWRNLSIYYLLMV